MQYEVLVSGTRPHTTVNHSFVTLLTDGTGHDYKYPVDKGETNDCSVFTIMRLLWHISIIHMCPDHIISIKGSLHSPVDHLYAVQ